MICKRMQALQGVKLPQVRVIDGTSVYKYDGSFELYDMKYFINRKDYRYDEDAKLSGNLEAFLKEGDQKAVPRKPVPEGKEISRSVIDMTPTFSGLVGKYTSYS